MYMALGDVKMSILRRFDMQISISYRCWLLHIKDFVILTRAIQNSLMNTTPRTAPLVLPSSITSSPPPLDCPGA